MVRINRVYTRTGDAGKTRLAGGQEIDKTAIRIESYGTVDELNSHLGLVLEALRAISGLDDLRANLLRVQNELFDLGSQLAVLAEDRQPTTPVIRPEAIRRLEAEIDAMNGELGDLTSFILPGGGEAGARLHVARTVCRRAERRVIRLGEESPLDGTEIPYLNRLSDWLFVAARFAAHRQGVAETLWRPGDGS